MEFKDKVMNVRGKLFLSQVQLAKELKVSFATVNRWENGHNQPSFITVCKFQDFCERNGIGFKEA